MRPGKSGIILAPIPTRLALSLACLCITVQVALASAQSKVILHNNVSKAHREELLTKLRVITGWTDLTFDSNGLLRLGTSEPRKGSRAARNLLSRSVSGRNLVLLEDASSRLDVVFCRVVQVKRETVEDANHPAYVVLIDFTDFSKIMGDKRAKAAFDVGWGVLHELDHVVEDSADPEVENHPGECEDSMNQMRRENNLPTRADYFFSLVPTGPVDPLFVTKMVRLRFEEQDAWLRTRHYWVMWDAALVGGLPAERRQSVSHLRIFNTSR